MRFIYISLFIKMCKLNCFVGFTQIYKNTVQNYNKNIVLHNKFIIDNNDEKNGSCDINSLRNFIEMEKNSSLILENNMKYNLLQYLQSQDININDKIDIIKKNNLYYLYRTISQRFHEGDW